MQEGGGGEEKAPGHGAEQIGQEAHGKFLSKEQFTVFTSRAFQP